MHLIDYDNGNHHLELRRDLRYDYVVPDLNGRRYLNYGRVAALARLAGEDASICTTGRARLKKVLRAELWSPSDRWFLLRTDKGQKDLRYTVQMFKLIGSPVLDKDQQEGLPSDLAEQIFSRILCWGERTPYWGDSFASNYVEYRKDTPLQSTF